MGLLTALAQQDFVVADVQGNVGKIIKTAQRARHRGAALVIFPELAVTGYPPEDLLLRRDCLEAVERGLDRITQAVGEGIDLIVGAPVRRDGSLFNAALHLSAGRVADVYYKANLPNYEVFDEKRYFKEGQASCVFELKGHRFGVTICEDIWDAAATDAVKRAGAQCIVNINASPFHVEKQRQRRRILQRRGTETGVPLVYVNLVGGQDELVFDGDSIVLNRNAEIVFVAPPFEEGLYFCDPFEPAAVRPPAVEDVELVRRALVTGLSAYVSKNGFEGLVVGLSGGIDSAVSLMIAVDAVGAGRVKAVMMPSPYTAPQSIEDAHKLAHRLGVKIFDVPIAETFALMRGELSEVFGGRPADVSEENLQARIRACFLMAVANKHRLMVVSTSNKSEIAVGYTTLYGDMIGGYAPLKDVFKTRVYELAHHYNRNEELIPPRIISRPPSAELAPGQRDTDRLPPYPLLDGILKPLIEHDASYDELVGMGFDAATVRRVQQMVVASEYKRRQAVPGVKITPRAFGKDRRYPISCRFDFSPPVPSG